MKNNVKKIIFIIIAILIIGAIIFFVLKNKNKEPEIEEYQPEEEISREQERQTMISLYFVNKNTREVEPEARLIDVKDLISNPYGILINLLIEGPKNESLETTIPKETTLLDATLEGDTLIINLSEEFINHHIGGKEEESKTIECIVNTLTELTEINSVKILINSEENRGFSDGEINFNEKFIRDSN